ncbi:hypothetical protein [Prosthecomicrobium hirschii]|nr:hypothetical protein [Prosthecomicrobium hirschii]
MRRSVSDDRWAGPTKSWRTTARCLAAAALLVSVGTVSARADEAEAAMDAYVQCLDQRYAALVKTSCEPATVLVTAMVTGCNGLPQRRLEQAILPFHRFFEEMKITMMGIRAAQSDRLLTRVIEYRATNPCMSR